MDIEITEHQESEVFDGHQIAPQFAIALKDFIYKNISLSASINGRSSAASGQSVNDVTDTKINIDTVTVTAVGITFDSTNKRFTALAAGNYIVSGVVIYQTTTDVKLYQAVLFKGLSGGSSSAYSKSSLISGGGTYSLSIVISDIVTLAVGDYIELYTFHNSGLAESTLAGSWLAIGKI